jgi:hypothetical protein
VGDVFKFVENGSTKDGGVNPVIQLNRMPKVVRNDKICSYILVNGTIISVGNGHALKKIMLEQFYLDCCSTV